MFWPVDPIEQTDIPEHDDDDEQDLKVFISGKTYLAYYHLYPPRNHHEFTPIAFYRQFVVQLHNGCICPEIMERPHRWSFCDDLRPTTFVLTLAIPRFVTGDARTLLIEYARRLVVTEPHTMRRGRLGSVESWGDVLRHLETIGYAVPEGLYIDGSLSMICDDDSEWPSTRLLNLEDFTSANKIG